MTVVYVRDTGRITGGNVVTAGADFAVLPIRNNHIISLVNMWHASTGASTITTSDNQGNTYVTDRVVGPAQNVDTGAIASGQIRFSAGTFTMTITPGTASGNYIEGICAEFSGVNQVGVDKGNTASGTTGANAATVTASGANAVNDELVMAVAGFTGSSSDIHVGTATASYTPLLTIPDDSSTNGIQASYKIVSAGQTSAASWTHDSVTVWVALISTYRQNPTVPMAAPVTAPSLESIAWPF